MIPHEQQQICMAPVQADDPVLNISLYFRSVLVKHFYVSNRKGARLYYGSNVPDMTQLFEPSHLANITLPFKYDAQVLFGPNFLQQVKVTTPAVYTKCTGYFYLCKSFFALLASRNRDFVFWEFLLKFVYFQLHTSGLHIFT